MVRRLRRPTFVLRAFPGALRGAPGPASTEPSVESSGTDTGELGDLGTCRLAGDGDARGAYTASRKRQREFVAEQFRLGIALKPLPVLGRILQKQRAGDRAGQAIGAFGRLRYVVGQVAQ